MDRKFAYIYTYKEPDIHGSVLYWKFCLNMRLGQMDFQLCLARVNTFKTLPHRSSPKNVLTFLHVYQGLCLCLVLVCILVYLIPGGYTVGKVHAVHAKTVCTSAPSTHMSKALYI